MNFLLLHRCISTLQTDVLCPALFKIPKRSCQLCSYSCFRSPFILVTKVSHFNSALSYSLHEALEQRLLTAGYIGHLLFKLLLFAVLDLGLSSWSLLSAPLKLCCISHLPLYYHWPFASLPKLFWITTFHALFLTLIVTLWCSPLWKSTCGWLGNPLAQGKSHTGTRGHLVHKWRQLEVRQGGSELTAEKSWRS